MLLCVQHGRSRCCPALPVELPGCGEALWTAAAGAGR